MELVQTRENSINGRVHLRNFTDGEAEALGSSGFSSKNENK